jgi:hypothetical protein
MNYLFTRAFAAVAFLAAASTPLAADTLLYQQTADNFGAVDSQNQPDGAGNFATAYDNFTLGTADNIDAVTWVGSYFNDPVRGTITSFQVTIYADSGGIPGAALDTTTISGNANETSLGTDFRNFPEFSYSATLSSVFAADAGTQYWLSVEPSLDFPQWAWETSSGAGDPGDHKSYAVFEGSPSVVPNDLAFSLRGSAASGTIPEPYSIVLLATVIGLVAISQRRRKATAR